MTPAPAVVTGANGFLGRHLCAGLVARGVPVRALVRRRGAAPAGTVESVCADLSSADDLAPILGDASVVFHAGGLAHTRIPGPGGEAAFHDANVHSTEALLAGCARAGVRRFVLVSSVAAVAQTSTGPLRADAAPRPVGQYGRSKLEAERRVRDSAGTGIAVAIVRPPMIYGEGMRGNPLRLFALVARGLPLPFGSIRNRRSFAYVGNVVEALRVAADAAAADAPVFFVSDGHDLSTPEFVRLVAASLGRPARLMPFPPAMLRLGGALADAVPGAPVGRDAIAGLTDSLTLDIAPLVAAGYRPPSTVEEGMRKSAAWFLSRGAGA
jgi:nucleoside-diphosphate-sugar epimerase